MYGTQRSRRQKHVFMLRLQLLFLKLSMNLFFSPLHPISLNQLVNHNYLIFTFTLICSSLLTVEDSGLWLLPASSLSFDIPASSKKELPLLQNRVIISLVGPSTNFTKFTFTLICLRWKLRALISSSKQPQPWPSLSISSKPGVVISF